MSHSIAPLPQHDHGDTDSFTVRAISWVLLLGLAFWPRLWFLGFWLFGPVIRDAYDGWFVPLLGLLLLPWLALSYACMWTFGADGVHGWEWAVVALGLLVDLVFWVGGRRSLQ
jgi:hypothetical protein